MGYGDRHPVTNAGRLMGVLIMTVGVGLFGTLTGFLANAFVGPPEENEETETTANDAQAGIRAELAEIRGLLEALQERRSAPPLPHISDGQ